MTVWRLRKSHCRADQGFVAEPWGLVQIPEISLQQGNRGLHSCGADSAPAVVFGDSCCFRLKIPIVQCVHIVWSSVSRTHILHQWQWSDWLTFTCHFKFTHILKDMVRVLHHAANLSQLDSDICLDETPVLRSQHWLSHLSHNYNPSAVAITTGWSWGPYSIPFTWLLFV